MPSQESKSCSNDNTSLVAKFADWGTSPQLTNIIDDFIQTNCESMKGASMDAEQNLEWTDLHREYVEMIETEMESFCKEHDTTGEEVFAIIDRINSGVIDEDDDNGVSTLEEDFIPQVIKLCDYLMFLEAMKAAALINTNNRIALEEARRAQDEGSEFNLSGCYVPRSDLIDTTQVTEYYVFTKCPWYFRKLFVAATHNIKDLTIQHEAEKFTILYTMPFFGTKRKEYIKDGKKHITTNTWGKQIETTCFEEADRVVIRVDRPHYAPEGYTTNSFEFKEGQGGARVIHWKRRIFASMESKKPAFGSTGNHAGTDLFCESMLEEDSRK